jgi:hypothetical protein
MRLRHAANSGGLLWASGDLSGVSVAKGVVRSRGTGRAGGGKDPCTAVHYRERPYTRREYFDSQPNRPTSISMATHRAANKLARHLETTSPVRLSDGRLRAWP